jgi:uncharacterized protein
MRGVMPAATILLVAIAFIALSVQLMKRSTLFFPERYPGGFWQPASFPLEPRDVWFTTADGVRLHAWHFEASPGAPLLIWFHGNGGNLTHRAPLAAEIALRGVSVLAFDYRGYGRSEGRPGERALYRDAEAVWEVSVNELGVPPERIIPYGESLGGPYAAWIAAERGAAAVVIENSFPSAAAVANDLYRPIPLGLFLPRSLRTLDHLRRAGRPVLVMHGRRDTVIPYRLGVAIYEGLDGPKELFTADRAGHGEIGYGEGDRYFEAVVSFAVRHSSPAESE